MRTGCAWLPGPVSLALLGALSAGRIGQGAPGPLQGAYAIPGPSSGALPSSPDRLENAIASLEATGRVRMAGEPIPSHYRKPLADFYRRRGFAPAWTVRGVPGRPAWQLAEAVSQSRLEGLDPEDYGAAALDSLLGLVSGRLLRMSALDPGQVVELELRLSHAFLKMGTHLLSGRIRPQAFSGRWHIRPETWDMPAHLERTLAEGGDVGESLRRLSPPYPEYALMKPRLAEYRKRRLLGGWPVVPEGPPLGPGSRGERIGYLCRRLQAGGDLGGMACPDSFTAGLEEGLRRFQARHALGLTGTADRATLAELRVPVEERIRQIELNLEYWRWLPRELGERHVRVNLADYRLGAYQGGRETLAMRVVIGSRENRTPVFSDSMVAVVVNPSWSVPASIAREEILPELRKDPGYLARHGMELLRDGPGGAVRIRQKPGAQNALGRLKFVLTNPYSIYLHDTPAAGYFQSSERALSHGCVRVEKPLDLAAWALAAGSGWTPDSLRKEIAKGRERYLPIRGGGIPVHILYWTAFVDARGDLNFRRDIYGWDRALGPVLAKADAAF